LSNFFFFFFFFWVFLGVIGPINWRATNDLWMSNLKKQCWKYKTRMSDSLLQFFWKINFRLLSSFSPLSSSFFYLFWVIKNLMAVSTRVLQNFLSNFIKQLLYSKGKDATIKDFKLKIVIYFNSPITKHWNPLHQTPISSPILYWIDQFLQRWKWLEVIDG